MSTNYDAIVIGAGHNGLTCACYLAKAGLKTVVLEQNSRIGGLSTTEEITQAGFHSDVHAFGYQFASLSPAAAELDLQAHGLELITPDIPFSHVFPDGDGVYMSRAIEATVETIAMRSQHDAQQWQTLYESWLASKDNIIRAFNSPPSAQSDYLALLESLPNGLDEYRFDLQTMRRFCDDHFELDKIKCLLGSFGLHTTLSPDDAGSGRTAWLFDCIIQDFGNRPVRGGMGNLSGALAKSLITAGGDIVTNASVERIVTENHQAKALQLRSGDTIDVNGVVASSADPATLVLKLLGEDVVGKTIAEKMRRYEWGVATMVLYLALDGPLEFRAGPAAASAAYIHISQPTLNTLSRVAAESLAGMLPSEPFMLICNDSVVDPSRVPAGKGLIKIMVYGMPYHIRGDAGGDIAARDWSEAKQPYADRIIDMLNRDYIPNLKSSIIARVVHSPIDQENKVSTAVGGTNAHGATPPYQIGAMRPIAELGQYRAPVKNLYLCGAGSFPCPGISFMPGRNAAQVILGDLGAASLA